MKRLQITLPALVISALLSVACVTAKKQYEHGQHAEAAGRWADAANFYIDTQPPQT